MLALYLVLAAAANVLVRVGSSFRTTPGIQAGFDTVGAAHAGGGVLGFAVTAFLVWRVWRGGYVSWVVLFLLNGVTAVLAGALLLANGGAARAVVCVLGVTGLVLLASPAARTRL